MTNEAIFVLSSRVLGFWGHCSHIRSKFRIKHKLQYILPKNRFPPRAANI